MLADPESRAVVAVEVHCSRLDAVDWDMAGSHLQAILVRTPVAEEVKLIDKAVAGYSYFDVQAVLGIDEARSVVHVPFGYNWKERIRFWRGLTPGALCTNPH